LACLKGGEESKILVVFRLEVRRQKTVRQNRVNWMETYQGYRDEINRCGSLRNLESTETYEWYMSLDRMLACYTESHPSGREKGAIHSVPMEHIVW
jgi:hypothetical protein